MKNNPERIMRKHIDKNCNVVGIYDITNSEREILFRNEVLTNQPLSFEEQRDLETLKNNFENGFNNVANYDGALYEILKEKDFEIRRKIEEYFNLRVEQERSLLTLNEINERYGIKPDTIRSYIARGEVIPKDKIVKIGRQWFIDSVFAAEKWGKLS